MKRNNLKFKNLIKTKQCLILWIIVIIYAAFIFQLSNSPVSKQSNKIQKTEQIVNATVNKLNEGTGENIDTEKNINNVKHFLLYFGFGFLLLFAFYSLNKLKKKRYSVPFAIIFGFLYGVSDEFHQYFISERDASFNDVLINGFGILIGVLIAIGILLIAKHYFKNLAIKKFANKSKT